MVNLVEKKVGRKIVERYIRASVTKNLIEITGGREGTGVAVYYRKNLYEALVGAGGVFAGQKNEYTELAKPLVCCVGISHEKSHIKDYKDFDRNKIDDVILKSIVIKSGNSSMCKNVRNYNKLPDEIKAELYAVKEFSELIDEEFKDKIDETLIFRRNIAVELGYIPFYQGSRFDEICTELETALNNKNFYLVYENEPEKWGTDVKGMPVSYYEGAIQTYLVKNK